MKALLHPTPHPSIYCRTSWLCPKDFRCFSELFQRRNCKISIHRLPCRSVSCRIFSKHVAAVGSFEADIASTGVPCSSSPDHSQSRSKTFLNQSSNSDGMNNFERQLQDLFNEVKRMIMMGNKSDAMDLLQANYEAVKEQISAGVQGMEEVATLDIIALGFLAAGDLKFVSSILDMLTPLTNMRELVDNQNDDELLLDSVLIHMGSMYSALGEFEKSSTSYQRATHLIENKYGNNSTFLITPLLGLAKAYGSYGRTKKAVDTYHLAINILECSRGAESKDLVVPLISLGDLLIKEGKPQDAERCFIRVLGIYINLDEKDNGRIGLAMCSLAHAKCAGGKVEEAIKLYKDALSVIRDSTYAGLDDGIVERMRIDLAELLHVVGRSKEGRELLKECLLITEKLKGKDHPSLVTHYQNLASSYLQSKDFAMGEHLLRTSLRIIRKADGPENPSVTFPMLNLAVTLYHLKRDDEAEELALEALDIREKAFGKSSVPVGEALDCLVPIQARLGKRDAAELLEMLNRVLEIQEGAFGHESEEVMVTLMKVIAYLEKLGKKAAKLTLQKRLSKLRTKLMHSVT